MSLKTFHLIFITVSTLLSFGMAVWALQQYRAAHVPGHLAFAVAALFLGLGLIIYGRYFLRKLKGIGYL